MSELSSSRRPLRYLAVLLVSGFAVGGVVACVFGALQWGLFGLSVGLAGSWLLFLVGLFGLYRREQRAAPDDPARAGRVLSAPAVPSQPGPATPS